MKWFGGIVILIIFSVVFLTFNIMSMLNESARPERKAYNLCEKICKEKRDYTSVQEIKNCYKDCKTILRENN